jgi:hypothetical protein
MGAFLAVKKEALKEEVMTTMMQRGAIQVSTHAS